MTDAFAPRLSWSLFARFDVLRAAHLHWDRPSDILGSEAQQTMLDLFAQIMDELTEVAQVEIARFDVAFAADHNAIGRVLKVPLVIEQYFVSRSRDF